MNDEIMQFSSDWFWGQVEVPTRSIPGGVLDYDHPITWIDTGEEIEERR